jgi:hypothetical protein
MDEGPKNVFEFIRVCLGPHVGESVFNNQIDIKRIAPGINDIAAGIGAQFDQIPTQKMIRLPIRFSYEIPGFAIYSFKSKIQDVL